MTDLEVLTFSRGGVHPESHKGLTRARPIEPVPPPSEVWLPLSQHIGEPAVPIVAKGDVVKRGQKIAEGGASGVPLHATISGKVKPLDRRPHPTLVSAPAIVIAASGAPEELEFPEVDRLIVNAAECEPYLTSDYRTLLARPREVVEGALAMARIIDVKHVMIGIENDKRDAVPALEAAGREALRESFAHGVGAGVRFQVVACAVRYPQGAEKQLVEALTGRTVRPRALPIEVGVVVQNVATAVAVYQALRFRRPLLDRVVTVTGDGVIEPRNLEVPIGTLLSHLVQACGGLRDETTRLIAGGPMMGRTLPRLDLPVVKGLNGLVCLTGKGPLEGGFEPCISCGRCLEACPLGLEPDQVSVRVEAGLTLDTGRFGPRECYECGACSYVCPARRPLTQFMQLAKSALRRAAETRIVP